MILLLAAILAIHVVLLCLFLATDSAERELADTKRELDEENALRSAWDQMQDPPQESQSGAGDNAATVRQDSAPTSAASQTASGSSASGTASLQKPSSSAAASSATAKPGSTALPASKEEKPAPSVPSTTYVRKPKKTASIKLDFTGAARDDAPGLKGIGLATAGLLLDMDKNTVLWAKNP